jgi:TolB-like protein
MKNIILACVCAFLTLCLAVQGKPNCAVATFEARGAVTADDATTLSDWLESELIELNQFSMVARTQMAKIVDAQKLSMSCDSADCAIELGKLLSARYIVFGSASKVGSTYVLIATLADVETAELIRTARFEQTGPIDDLLKTGIPSIARKLASLDTSPEPVQNTTTTNDKSWFKRNWPWLAGGAAVVVGGVALAGGGGGDESDGDADSLSGTWRGISSTSQVATQLSLYQSGTSISGNLIWPGGDTRSVSGWVSAKSVTLNIGGGDVWHMTWSGDILQGTAQKKGGGTYALQFTR